MKWKEISTKLEYLLQSIILAAIILQTKRCCYSNNYKWNSVAYKVKSVERKKKNQDKLIVTI